MPVANLPNRFFCTLPKNSFVTCQASSTLACLAFLSIRSWRNTSQRRTRKTWKWMHLARISASFFSFLFYISLYRFTLWHLWICWALDWLSLFLRRVTLIWTQLFFFFCFQNLAMAWFSSIRKKETSFKSLNTLHPSHHVVGFTNLPLPF